MFSHEHKTRTASPILSVAAAMLLVWAGFAAPALAQGKGGGKKADTTPPAAVDDLTVLAWSHNSITIGWTATGDNGNSGTASEYDIRYSTTPIDTEADFARRPTSSLAVRFSSGPRAGKCHGGRLVTGPSLLAGSQGAR